MGTSIDVNFWFFLSILCFTSTLLIQFIANKLLKHRPEEIQRVPPSPPALPIIGHLHLVSSQIHKSFQTLSSRYGPFMTIRVGASTSYVVSDAIVAEQIFKTHDVSFASRPSFGSSEHDIYKESSFFISEYGSYWRFLKKVCMTELLSPSSLNRFASIREEERLKLLEVLTNCSEKGEVCNVGKELLSMTNNTICRVAMSTRCSENSNQSGDIKEFIDAIMKISGKLAFGEMLGPLKKFDVFGFGKKLKNIMLKYDKLVDGILMEHEGENQRERKDMMDSLIEISKDENAQVKLSRINIKALLMDMFLGGTDTTSTSTQWALAELISHPQVFKKLRNEIKTVIGINKLVQESDIPNLPYLQATIKESLRLHPPLPLVPRKCREDCEINGYKISSDSRFLINVYAIMRDGNVWENPNEFLPERFLGSGPGLGQVDFKNVPFGGGRRGCPGSGLALTVMSVTIATLVQCFDWKMGGDDGKVDMEEGSGFSVAMAKPLLCYPVIVVNPLVIAQGTKWI